ncbi:MAG: hypothetical protein WCT10_02025 [Patescibacteria group bacterium]|jgi:hypothetical protein
MLERMTPSQFDINKASDDELAKAVEIPAAQKQETRLSPADRARQAVSKASREILDLKIHGAKQGIPDELQEKIVEARRQNAIAETIAADPTLDAAAAETMIAEYLQMQETEHELATKKSGQIDISDAEIDSLGAGLGEELAVTTERSSADQLKLAASAEKRAMDTEEKFQADTTAFRQNAEVQKFVEDNIRGAADEWDTNLPGKQLELAARLGSNNKEMTHAAMQAIDSLIKEKLQRIKGAQEIAAEPSLDLGSANDDELDSALDKLG